MPARPRLAVVGGRADSRGALAAGVERHGGDDERGGRRRVPPFLARRSAPVL